MDFHFHSGSLSYIVPCENLTVRARFKLNPYEIRLRTKGNTDDYFDLSSILLSEGSFDGTYFANQYSSDLSFTELFEEYCEDWHQNPVDDQGKEKTYSLKDDPNSDDADNPNPYLRPEPESNILEGVLSYGEYGTAADHLDTDTGEREQNARNADVAAETPIPFLLHVPEDNPRKAVIVLESVGNTGIKSLVADARQDKLPDGLMLEMEPVKESNIYQRIRQAQSIPRLRLGTTGKPSERNDRFSSIFGDSLCNQSIVYEPYERSSLSVDANAIEDWLENVDDEEDKPYTLNGETFDQIRLTLKEDGSENTIDIIEGKAKIVETIDDTRREGGYPVPNEVGNRARRFINQEIPFASGLSTNSNL